MCVKIRKLNVVFNQNFEQETGKTMLFRTEQTPELNLNFFFLLSCPGLESKKYLFF